MTPSPARRLAAWSVHLFTASGAVAGLLAMLATIRGDAQSAFAWMAYTLFVDALDGTLARAVPVKTVLPRVDGTKLDDLVDFVTYVMVPGLFLVEMELFPPALAVPTVALMIVASAYGFSQRDAKTPQHFFTGFPSYWNIVAFYLYVLAWPAALNAAIVALLAVLVFVPIRYVYPSRTPMLRSLTVTLGIVWAALILWVMARLDDPPRGLVVASLAFPLYYVVLSAALQRRPSVS